MNNKLDKLARKYTIEDLEGILDKIPYLVWLKDKEGKFIYVNKSGAENMGLAKDEMIGRSDYEILDYNMAKKCYETDASLMESNNDLYNEEYINIDGQDRLYKVHKYILNRETTKENILCGLAEEISLDRSLQLKLESNLFKCLDKSKDEDDPKKYIHSTLISLKKVLNCKNIDILLYNENEKAFIPYISEDKDESIFKDNLDLYINEAIENKLYSNDIDCNRYSEIYDKIIKLQENNVEENLKIKHIKLAGKLFGLICISYNKDIDANSKDDSFLDEILNKICIIIKQIENKDEIVSIRKKEDELKSMIELESIKTDFFANVSHEFRTPVNIILSVVQLLNLYNDDTKINIKDEKYREYLDILKQNSYRLLRLVNNIIDTAKINNNLHNLKLENTNIIKIVEDVAMSTVVYAKEKKRNIIFDTDEEEVILACDKEKIERIILNLISNAIKFSNVNTDIEIKINTILDLNKVFISIKNYGECIEKCNREKIFGKCTQTDDLFIRRNEGCGIGLFLARKFVEMHNGKIYIDDIKDATQLTFYLPINTIDKDYNYNGIINENDFSEKCNIEFSDIYA
ncbi:MULTISPECIES: sensor histidine kinase [unclassified Clostridium]|uniref:sensor histidine kinase n=1 Tax=unclassified Clostridium TaxID=2614128 RepID=UPI0025C1EDF9|nr:PAS domain-containing sensor histidine kinase [Clostridium sp.]MDY2629953.1 PAS domain-containing sensor histidine kinase [Clostridium sp.]MDY6228262.1 PAS domain-containing sensor histidine kinase [Clostridium sp.]